MREVIILIGVSLSSLFILGYSIHMFIGGLVSEQTEIIAISIACTIGLLIIAAMGMDIIRQRRRR